MSGITTHVLDTSRGKPAAGVPVTLEALVDGAFRRLGAGETDGDGRLKGLVPDGHELRGGTYRLIFDTGAYFRTHGVAGFYPEVHVVFLIRDPDQHYHVPLLLGPYGYSTYRGS